jgi:thioesterase domain-containing protein/acyl carrier protein
MPEPIPHRPFSPGSSDGLPGDVGEGMGGSAAHPLAELLGEGLAPDHTRTSGQGVRLTLQHEILRAIFAEVLEFPVEIDDNFFEFGGNSLLATRLVERIYSTLGAEINITLLFEAPTVAALAARLNDSVQRSYYPVLLPLRRTGNRAPLFCTHPLSGVSWCFAPLLKNVPSDIPLYGLQARGLNGEDDLARSVPEMAADYITQIRAVESSDPCYLLGWSFGGLIAHEMAAQLEAAGSQVAGLVLMDVSLPKDTDELVLPEAGENTPPGDVANDLTRDILNYGIKLSDKEIVNTKRVILNSAKLRSEYTPGVFTGDTLFVMTEDEDAGDLESVDDWRPYLPGKISEFRIPCGHGEMIRPDMLMLIGDAIADWTGSRHQ